MTLGMAEGGGASRMRLADVNGVRGGWGAGGALGRGGGSKGKKRKRGGEGGRLSRLLWYALQLLPWISVFPLLPPNSRLFLPPLLCTGVVRL